MSTNPDLHFQELESQDARDYWQHEAREFTPWLAEQIESEDASHLEDVLGLDLEVIEIEKRVGKYSVDILAEVVDDGRQVVIENQLGASDHNHLGQCIAYAAGVDADIIVWISPQFNDEHQDAFQWLNKNSRRGIDLFAIRLEVWKIGESEPAVRLNPVEDPSEWQEKAKRPDKELTETKKLQEEFWTSFRDLISEGSTRLSPRKPRPQHWYNNPIGKTGFSLTFTVDSRGNELRVSVIIRDDSDAYWELAEEREAIESEFGGSLEWIEPEETRAGKERSMIRITRSGNVNETEKWDEYLDWLLENGGKLHEVFYPRIQQL